MNKNSYILEKLIDEDFGIKGRGRWYHGLEHDSLVLDQKRGLFFWNSEGIVGDALVYLTRVRRYSLDQARDYLKNFDYEGTFVYTYKSKTDEEIVVYPKLVDVFYEDGVSHRDYFYRRGLTDLTIDRFKLGWYNGFNTVPFYDDGTFRNFQLRRDVPMKAIRGYYHNVGPLLFNSDILNLVDEVYYVEGPVDAMIMSQNGLPTIASNSGGGYLSEWYSKFVKVKKINIIFDNDKAGLKEAIRLAKFLGEMRCKIYTFEDSSQDGYDPVDFFLDGKSPEQLVELVDKEGKYVFEL